MRTLILVGGWYHLGFGLFHLAFWRLFDWPRQLAALGAINRRIVPVLNLCLTFVFIMFAWLSLRQPDALLATPLGNAVLGFIAAFWLLRAIMQITYFGLRHPLSLSIFVVFLGGTALYALPWMATIR